MIRFRVGPSVFQLKKKIVYWNSAIVILLILFFVYMYYVHEDSKGKHVLIPKEMKQENLVQLEYRLGSLEKELQQNRELLGEVKNTILGVIKMKPISDVPVDLTNPIANRSSVKLSGIDCPSHLGIGVEADERTMEIYKNIDFENRDGGVWKQGWTIEYDETQWNENQKLKIFVVPHSHNDPGWIKTFDKYFKDQTQHILNNMVAKMKDNKFSRFIWAEISFFAVWWERIDSNTRTIVKRLLSNGQLEIVTGGWVMNDEATSHYYAMLEQMIIGHQWLQQNLEYRPKNGWAIDPFGLSPTMAYLLKRMGLDNMVVQRVHYSVKKYLSERKSLEFLWRQQWDQNHTMDMLCHIMPFYSYDIPHTCGPDPKICCQFDFKRLPGNKVNCPWRIPPVSITDKNIADRAWILLDQYRKKSQLFRTNVVMIQLGDDFRFDKINEWDQQFNNYQKLFNYINNKKDWHAVAQFGTLEDYFSALREESGIDQRRNPLNFPSLVGDFLTYADRDDHYWSGYYTTRPFYKNMDRALEAHLRGAEILFSLMLAKMDKQTITNVLPYIAMLMGDLVSSRRTLGLFQHHDAITGTAKDHVVIDYASKMSTAFQRLRNVIGQCAVFLLSPNFMDVIDEQIALLQTDEYRSQNALPQKIPLKFTHQKRNRYIVLYNSLGHSRIELVKVIISSPSVIVKDSAGNVVPSQINPVFKKKKLITVEFELIFYAEVPALSLITYSVHANLNNEASSPRSSLTFVNCESVPLNLYFSSTLYNALPDIMLKSYDFTVFLNGSTGMLKRVHSIDLQDEVEINIKFLKYGTRTKGKDRSGAYLFLPDSEAKEIDYNNPEIVIITGSLMTEVIVFLREVEHHILLKNSPGFDGTSIEIFNIVNLSSENNKELIMRFCTSILNMDQDFYTDLNGFQMIRRHFFEKIPIQGNVYPVTTMAHFEDGKTRFSFLTSHSVGVTSLQPGMLEAFLDRRLNQDDNRGLQQGVTDNKETPIYFRILLEKRLRQIEGGTAKYPSLLAHQTSLSLLHPIFVLMRLDKDIDPNVIFRNPDAPLQPKFSPVGTQLPCDVHLLNLRTSSYPDGAAFIPANDSALFLHRLGFDCGFKMFGGCTMHNGSMSLDTLFPGLFGNVLEEVSLSFIYTGNKFSRDVLIQLPAMEIVTLKIQR